MSTDITVFADDLDIEGHVQTSTLTGNPIATLTLSTIPREGESETSITFYLDSRALEALCALHLIPLKKQAGEANENL
jgi:hypothetical protein